VVALIFTVLKQFPSGIAQAPPHLEFEVLSLPAMPKQFVHKPFVLIRCPKVIWLRVYSIGKQ